MCALYFASRRGLPGLLRNAEFPSSVLIHNPYESKEKRDATKGTSKRNRPSTTIMRVWPLCRRVKKLRNMNDSSGLTLRKLLGSEGDPHFFGDFEVLYAAVSHGVFDGSKGVQGRSPKQWIVDCAHGA